MTFFDLLKTRHSIRKFIGNKPIEPQLIDQILQSGLMAPASKRRNPWEFVVVQDKSTLNKLSQSRPYGSQLIENAAAAIVMLANNTKSDLWIEDATIAAIIMQIEAHELSLGSCWVQVRKRLKDENTTTESFIKNLLNIPDDYSVLCMLAFGYADETKQPFELENLDYSKIHHELF